MRQLPKAIPELDGGLFLARPVVELLEAVLLQHETLLRDARPARAAAVPGEADESDDPDRKVLAELRELLRMTGPRLALPSPRELLALEDPRAQRVARNLLREG